ncbi:MAG: SixA phosphatase family protein [Actinomycetota bacterium]
MPTLFVLRHAKSSWAEDDRPDHERRLAERGQKAGRRMATHIMDARIAPDVVLCSSATRARETLALVAAGFSTRPDVRIDERLYGADAAAIIALLQQELPPEVESVLVVGHNPALQDLVVELAGEGDLRDEVAHKFPSGALATLQVGRAWAELGPGEATLDAFVKPKQLDR